MNNVCVAIVTYRRLSHLAATLSSIQEQSFQPKSIVIIDNAADLEVEKICKNHPLASKISYFPMDSNLGPAGGTAEAMNWFIQTHTRQDWFLRVDDDRTLPDGKLISDLVDFAMSKSEHERFGGVGLAGSRYDRRAARLIRPPVSPAFVEVDFLATNHFALFSAQGIFDVGPMDATLFFGMSEVEFGLRLRDHNYSLWLHGPRVFARRKGKPAKKGPTAQLAEPGWRRYYSLRNSIVVARRYGGTAPALRVTVVRCFAKPIIGLVVSPRLALANLNIGARAASDAWRGRMGRQVDPETWERNHGLLANQDEMRLT